MKSKTPKRNEVKMSKMQVHINIKHVYNQPSQSNPRSACTTKSACVTGICPLQAGLLQFSPDWCSRA